MGDSINPDKHDPTKHGNQSHGAEKALSEVRHGKPLTGVARQRLGKAVSEYEEYGRAGMVELAALEFHVIADLYLQAALQARQLDQLDRFDSMIKRWGWLKGNEIRAWREVREEAKAAPDLAIDIDAAISAAEEAVKDGKYTKVK